MVHQEKNWSEKAVREKLRDKTDKIYRKQVAK